MTELDCRSAQVCHICQKGTLHNGRAGLQIGPDLPRLPRGSNLGPHLLGHILHDTDSHVSEQANPLLEATGGVRGGAMTHAYHTCIAWMDQLIKTPARKNKRMVDEKPLHNQRHDNGLWTMDRRLLGFGLFTHSES